MQCYFTRALAVVFPLLLLINLAKTAEAQESVANGEEAMHRAPPRTKEEAGRILNERVQQLDRDIEKKYGPDASNRGSCATTLRGMHPTRFLLPVLGRRAGDIFARGDLTWCGEHPIMYVENAMYIYWRKPRWK